MAEIFDSLTEAMTRHGGFRLTASQIDALTKAAFEQRQRRQAARATRT